MKISKGIKNLIGAIAQPLKAIKWLPANSNKGFSLLSGLNRPVKASHVTKLSKSVLEMGCIRPVVVATISFITGVPVTYIIDGQHLYFSLIRLNMEVPHIHIDIKDQRHLVEVIALLNASSRSWSMQDYITAWTSVNDEYQTLNTMYNTYDIELSILTCILMDLEITHNLGGGPGLGHVKYGTFKISNKERSKIVLDYLTDVFKVIKRLDRQQNRFVCAEFVKMLRINESSYNHKKFMTNLERNKDRFVLATHEADTLSQMFKNLL